MPFRSTFELVAGSILAEHIAVGAITSDKIANGAITAEKILDGTITGVLIADGAVTANKIAAQAISAGKIEVGAVGNTQLADNAVTAAKILNGTITGVLIADGAVTATKIAANTITASQIAVGGVTSGALASSAVTNAKIATDAVTAAKILNGTITGVLIADGAVTATKLSATAIDGKTITGGIFQTDTPGNRRLVIQPGGFDGASDEINWYPLALVTGETPGRVWWDVSGDSAATAKHEMLITPGASGTLGISPQIAMTTRQNNGGSASIMRLFADQVQFGIDGTSGIVTDNGIASEVMRPITVTGATYSPVGAVSEGREGTAFTAPQSGAVKITVGGFIRALTAGQAAYLAFEMRLGVTVGSGTITTAQTSGNGCGNYNTQFVGSERATVVDGLTPGVAYNVRMFVVGGAGGSVFSGPRMIVEAML